MLTGETWVPSSWGRGPREDRKGWSCFLNRWPATYGFCLLLQQLGANAIYLEKERRKISFPSPLVSELLCLLGGGVRLRHLVWK